MRANGILSRLGTLTAFLVVLLPLQGCIYLGRNVYFESRRPVFPLPEKQQLQELPDVSQTDDPKELRAAYDAAVGNLVKVMNREKALEDLILYWNTKAVETNEANGYTLPKPTP